MTTAAQVTIHPSQFPDAVRRDLIVSLRTRQANHKFHYDSHKQTQKWLALHEAHSPARRDEDCLKTYDAAFRAVARQLPAKKVHLLGLGCGGGQKDVRLLKLLQAAGRQISYSPSDVSTAMVLVARQAALAVVPAENISPLVCDLATAADLPAALAATGSPRAGRLVTFFGMIPNFEPQVILPRLAALVGPQDWLLFSANLAPGADYSAGLQRILPQYDNTLTREWLLTFLLDFGVEREDGRLEFTVERGAAGLQRVVARFHFRRTRAVHLAAHRFRFARGESFRLFFSYRYTPVRVGKILARHGLEVRSQWITKSEEEGVFLCRRTARKNQ